SLCTDLGDKWTVTTSAMGTTLQNVETRQFLTANGPWDISVNSPLPVPMAYWTIVNNADGSISLRNQSNGNYLDADNDRSVGLSSEIRNDDGWFVTEIELTED
ncbi:MAG: hypothetical protein AAF497_07310, partial [Planctomycetota bacterium]